MPHGLNVTMFIFLLPFEVFDGCSWLIVKKTVFRDTVTVVLRAISPIGRRVWHLSGRFRNGERYVGCLDYF